MSIPSEDYSNHSYVCGQLLTFGIRANSQSKKHRALFFCNYFVLTSELGKGPWVTPAGCIQSVFHIKNHLENKGKRSQIASHLLLLQNYKQPRTLTWGGICLGSPVRFLLGASQGRDILRERGSEGSVRFDSSTFHTSNSAQLQRLSSGSWFLCARLTAFLAMSSGPTSVIVCTVDRQHSLSGDHC